MRTAGMTMQNTESRPTACFFSRAMKKGAETATCAMRKIEWDTAYAVSLFVSIALIAVIVCKIAVIGIPAVALIAVSEILLLLAILIVITLPVIILHIIHRKPHHGTAI